MEPNPPPTATPDYRSVRRRVWIPTAVLLGLGGIVAHLFLFLGIRAPLPEIPESGSPPPFAAFDGGGTAGGAAMRERAWLLDSKPLFMPTPWNTASDLQNIARLRDETELFRPFAPQIRLMETVWSLPPGSLPDSPPTSLLLAGGANFQPLSGFGRVHEAAESGPLAPRAFAVRWETISAGRGRAGLFILTPGELARPAPDLWTPAEFWLAVDPRALLRTPLRLTSSGDSAWDEALREFIASEPFRRRLPAGYYRVTVGP